MNGPGWINSFTNGKEKLTVLNSYSSGGEKANKKEIGKALDSV